MVNDLNLLKWNWSQYKAAGRHVVSYAAGCVTVAVSLHFLSPSEGAGLTDNINSIAEGVVKIATGVAGILAALAPFYTSFKAAHSANPIISAENLTKEVPGTTVVTTPAIAAASPSDKVVSNTETKVVPK